MRAADSTVDLWNFAPLASLLLLGLALAALPVAWIAWRHRGEAGQVQRALIWFTLFLTLDLVLFGAFTRLTDSGLGCPDWPGCYGSASPVGAATHIDAAQTALPSGPVTFAKAWIEMIHRYLATGVGALIVVMTVGAWRLRHTPIGLRVPLAWPVLTLVWVILQGLFGALTVTLKLQPLIVTAHLLGGMGLLALLMAQAEASDAAPQRRMHGLQRLRGGPWKAAAGAVAVLLVAQIALGAWVSTNYAVLACTEFPTCHDGMWWPPMDFATGFEWWRPLGRTADGRLLDLRALTAIHMVHRLLAVVVVTALLGFAVALLRADKAHRPWAIGLAGLAFAQTATGISNVVLGWPLVAALAHTGGAALLVLLLTRLAVRVGWLRVSVESEP